MKTIYKVEVKCDDWGNAIIEIIKDKKYYFGTKKKGQTFEEMVNSNYPKEVAPIE